MVFGAAGRGMYRCNDFEVLSFLSEPRFKLSLFFNMFSHPLKGFTFIFNLKCYVLFLFKTKNL